jgi:hypothetical protein
MREIGKWQEGHDAPRQFTAQAVISAASILCTRPDPSRNSLLDALELLTVGEEDDPYVNSRGKHPCLIGRIG